MDTRRFIVCSALGIVAYLLVNAWQTDYPSRVMGTPTKTLSPFTQTETDDSFRESPPNQSNSEKPIVMIDVQTDVLTLKIDLTKGNIVGANLLNYPIDIEDKQSAYPLLTNQTPGQYIAISQWYALHHADQALNFNFRSQALHYALEPGQQELTVNLDGEDTSGLKVTKQFRLSRGSYVIQVRYVLTNAAPTPWVGYFNTQLLRDSPAEDKTSPFHVGSYTGASYSNPGVHRYQKVTFKDMLHTPLDQAVTGGWFAMQQRYFVTAWIPDKMSKNRLYTRSDGDGSYVIGAVSQAVTINPDEQKSIQAQLYLGPEIADTLKSVAPGLEQTIDYGWLWFISSLLFSVMKTIYQWVGNWGWSIVLVTALVKLAFYRLSATSYRSMAAMRKLQPKMQALRERYGEDKAKISQATMELYRQEKVNPLAGCLPLIIQVPVMIGLYWVMIESVELRQAPFIFWIRDLALPDPWHVLPLLMGLTMFVQQQLNPAPPDPMQAKIMLCLPLLFTGLFWNFPAGLVLYWTVNNTLTILQQWHITRQYNDKKPKNPKKTTRALAK